MLCETFYTNAFTRGISRQTKTDAPVSRRIRFVQAMIKWI